MSSVISVFYSYHFWLISLMGGVLFPTFYGLSGVTGVTGVTEVTGVTGRTEIPYHQDAFLPALELPYLAQGPTLTPEQEQQVIEAVYLNQQGYDLWQQGQAEAALDLFQQALTTFQTLGAKAGAGNSLNNRGLVYFSQGNYDLALENFGAALEIFEALSRSPDGDPAYAAYTLQYLGETYREQRDYDRSQAAYEKALGIFRQLIAKASNNPDNSDHPNPDLTSLRTSEKLTLGALGALQFQVGEYPEALAWYQQVLPIDQESEDYIGEAHTLNNLGVVYANLSNYAQALDAYQRALAIVRRLATGGVRYLGEEAAILNNLSALFFSLGDSPRSLQYAQEAAELYDRWLAEPQSGVDSQRLELLQDSLGQSGLTSDFVHQRLALRAPLGELAQPNLAQASAAVNLNNLAHLYRDRGDFTSALALYLKALESYRSINNLWGVAIALSNIGQVYSLQGQGDQAETFHQQALTLYQQLDDRAGEALALSALAQGKQAEGEAEAALNLYRQAGEIQAAIGDRASLSITLSNRGAIFLDLGQNDRAIATLEEAANVLESLRPGLSDANKVSIFDLGSVTYRYWQEALVADDRGEEALVVAERGRARSFVELLAARIAPQTNPGSPTNSTRSTNLTGLTNSTSLTNSTNLANSTNPTNSTNLTNSINLANLTNLTNSINLANLTNPTNSINLASSTNPNNSINLTNSINLASSTNLTNSINLTNPTNPANPTNPSNLANSTNLTNSANLINSTNPNLAPALLTPSLAEIQAIARSQKATLVEYSLIGPPNQETELYLWVVQPDGTIHFRRSSLDPVLQTEGGSGSPAVPAPTPGPRTGVASGTPAAGSSGAGSPEAASPEHQSLTRFVINSRQALQTERRTRQSLQQLYALLIGPIADLLPSDPQDRVIMIPQGALFLVPFPALLDPQQQPLIAQHTLLTAPAIQVLGLTQQLPPVTSQQTLIVGNPRMPNLITGLDQPPVSLPPLPGAEAEAIAIAQFLQTQALVGDEATETTIVTQMPQARIIHFATHGLLDEFKVWEQGPLGAIALAPTGESGAEDGFLTTAEILDLNLQADLVVLSACNTGRGKITGDGVIGLSRAFLAAGSHSVIVSLWSVPDTPTSELMMEFYRQWQQTGDKAQALRQAMLHTLEQYPNPTDWAAFTLVGEK